MYLFRPDSKLISVESSWGEILNWYGLPKQKFYLNTLGSAGSSAEKLFQGHVQELKEALDEDRLRIKQLLEEEAEKEEDAAAGKKRFVVWGRF